MNIKKVLLPVSIVSVALVAALATGCGGKQTPVARVEVEPRLVKLPFSQARTVRLTWTPSAPLEGETPMVFVHLLDDKDRKKVSRTFDHPFPERWREGAPVTDELRVYQSALAPPLPAGKYQVVIGLYGKDGKRWALDGLGEPVGRTEYNAFTIEVPAQSPGPRFAFSPTWGPIDPGGDRQVLARRWMADRGAIRVLNQKGPGVVWLLVQIPAMDQPDYKLALAPGASLPTVLVQSNCGGTETSFSGPGNHEVEVVMDTPPPDGVCRVELTANFTLQSPKNVGGPRSVSLENIAWLPAGAGGARAPAPQPTGTPSSPSAPQ